MILNVRDGSRLVKSPLVQSPLDTKMSIGYSFANNTKRPLGSLFVMKDTKIYPTDF